MNQLGTIQRYRASGFSLVELMVVVTMVGILSAIAMPSYRSYMLKANRTDAKASLLKIAAAQEKHYLQNNTYTADLAELNQEAISGYDHFTLAITQADATGFIATATAREQQVQDDACLLFAMNELGRKFGGIAPIGDANNDEDCWGNR